MREEFDCSAIVDPYTEERGYPPYHPVTMMALLCAGRAGHARPRGARRDKDQGERLQAQAMSYGRGSVSLISPDRTLRVAEPGAEKAALVAEAGGTAAAGAGGRGKYAVVYKGAVDDGHRPREAAKRPDGNRTAGVESAVAHESAIDDGQQLAVVQNGAAAGRAVVFEAANNCQVPNSECVARVDMKYLHSVAAADGDQPATINRRVGGDHFCPRAHADVDGRWAATVECNQPTTCESRIQGSVVATIHGACTDDTGRAHS